MDFTISLFNLIELVILMASLITAYWKLSTRQSLMEQRIGTLEKQAETNEGKIEKRLDTIEEKMDKLIIEVTKLKSRE